MKSDMLKNQFKIIIKAKLIYKPPDINKTTLKIKVQKHV